jgi:nicotinamide/nicotinate riboside kinase
MTVKFIGLSGPSSSGKTTLSYLLRHIFPKIVYILHADDFCKEFEDIPFVNGYRDCDGPDAVDFERMCRALDHMSSHDGLPPDDFESWQDEVFPGQEEKALKTVPNHLIRDVKSEISRPGLDLGETKFVILDGFLLFHNPEVRKRLDLRMFFRLSHDVAKERRFSRQGYGIEAQPDEFWKTENYFETMVWRCYNEQHAFMFHGGDVEGDVDEQACSDAGIKVMPGMNRSIENGLRWTTRQIVDGEID